MKPYFLWLKQLARWHWMRITVKRAKIVDRTKREDLSSKIPIFWVECPWCGAVTSHGWDGQRHCSCGKEYYFRAEEIEAL